jgi:hypothetical protein
MTDETVVGFGSAIGTLAPDTVRSPSYYVLTTITIWDRENQTVSPPGSPSPIPPAAVVAVKPLSDPLAVIIAAMVAGEEHLTVRVPDCGAALVSTVTAMPAMTSSPLLVEKHFKS